MIKYLMKKSKQNRGFTLMEVMVVVAILAVIVMIAVPSVISMQKNMKFTERNDYAKSIFMAAQSNLTQMRSTGQLERLNTLAEEKAQDANPYGAPTGYHYTFPTGNANALEDTYNLVLPVNSIDSTIRDEQVIIEYNPKAGIVYSVFYYEGDDGELLGMYQDNSIDRAATEEGEKNRKDILVGYYSVGNVDALEAQELNVCQTSSEISFTNTNEGVITVTVPIVDNKGNNIFPDAGNNLYEHYIAGLEVTLTMTGENGGTFVSTIKGAESPAQFTPDNFNNAVLVNFTADSLTTSFATITATSEQKIQPGDNITVTAEVTFIPSATDPIVMIESSTLAGINPMYHSLTQNPDYDSTKEGTLGYTTNPYILAISNARHLQNLDYLDGTFAQNIESIVFVAQTEEDTVTNSGTGGTGGSGTGENTSGGTSNGSDTSKEEGNSAQVLTVSDTNTNTEGSSGGNTGGEAVTPVNTEIAIDLSGINFTPISNTALSNGPKIIGNGVKISNLKISTAESTSTGLFASLKGASIEGITLVDPIVESTAAALTTSDITKAAATGALIGVADSVTVTDCSVTSSAADYYIAGKQLIGGLVGYAKGGSKFANCITDVIVSHSEEPVQTTDSIPYAMGGMVGYSDGSEFKTCDTTAAVYGLAATETDLGGLIGKAVSTTLTDCTTKATVSGVDEYLCNAGGLVGYAGSTTFSNCDAVSDGDQFVTVTSGDNTHLLNGDGDHNALGGLVGYAEGTATAPTTFSNCNIALKTAVVSSNYSYSDMGGMVGYAKGVSFTTCSSNASVNGTQPVKDDKAVSIIPNNNLGGFVGYSENSDYDDIDVTLNYLPVYAMDAGVFAGYISGGDIDDLDLDLTATNSNSANHTVQYFGAVSGRIKDSSLTTAVIKTSGNINNANHIAGVSYITQNTAINDVAVTIGNGRMFGNQTAGFVGENGSGSTIQNSSVLGDITYTSDYKVGNLPEKNGVSGFTYQNSGTIKSCIANVTLPGGSAFVAANNGTVKDCYGWAWKSSSEASAIDLRITQKCSYSYFINGDTMDMVLYEGLGTDSASTLSTNILDTDALTDVWALELLNASTSDTSKHVWEAGSENYPYPKLEGMSHVGKSKDPVIGDYPYYLYYVEEYSDDNGYILMEYSADGKIVSGGVSSSGLSTPPVEDNIHYYLYHRTDDALKSHGTALDRTKYADMYKDISQLYTIYELKKDQIFTVDNITFNTCYPLYNTSGHYRIRTAQQFANIAKNTDGTFYIEQSISPSASLSSFGGTMTAASGVTITATKSLVTSLSGTLSGLTVTGLTEPMVGEVSGGTISGCDVTANITSGSNVGVIAGTMSSGSISKVTASGSVSGSGNVGGAIGEITGGTVSDVTVNVSVSASGDNAKAGMFVGYAESGTFNKCSASDENSAFPFANFPARQTSISEKAEYVSIYNHTANSDSTPPTAPMYLTADRFSMAAIEDTNLTLITSDVSVTSCKLNGTLVSITPVYYYSISELKCAIESYMTVITTEERDPSFDSVDTSETGYYIYISEDNYAKITSTNIKEETDAEGNTTYSFSYRTENMTDEASDIVINNISSKNDKVSKYGLKLYRRTVNTPSKDTYLLFDSTGDNILIHNENGYSWENYSEITKSYSHMVWSYKEGVFTNEYDSATVTIGDPASSKTYYITYDGKTVESRLYPVDAYQTVTLEDTANAFNTTLSK